MENNLNVCTIQGWITLCNPMGYAEYLIELFWNKYINDNVLPVSNHFNT